MLLQELPKRTPSVKGSPQHSLKQVSTPPPRLTPSLLHASVEQPRLMQPTTPFQARLSAGLRTMLTKFMACSQICLLQASVKQPSMPYLTSHCSCRSQLDEKLPSVCLQLQFLMAHVAR